MTLARLEEKMLHQLQGFVKKEKRKATTVETILKSVLGASLDQTSKATVYKQLVALSCKLEDTKLKRWPDGWIDLAIQDLAPQLLST